MDAVSRWPPLSAEALWQAMPGLLDGLADGVQVWSADGALLYANPATLALFGLAADMTPYDSAGLMAQAVDALGAPLSARGLPLSALAASGEDNQVLVGIRGDAPVGVVRWLRVSRVPAWPTRGAPADWCVTTCADVSRFVAQEQALQQQAYHDALTGLPNRLLLADRLPYALAAAQRRDELLAVCVMDLDGFKPVNDTLGHKAGDRVLQEVAYRLRNAIRGEDMAARIGGDEFALVLGGLRGVADCELVLTRILRDLARPIAVEAGQAAHVSGSIGVAVFPGDVAEPDQLLRHADQAMYQAKAAGKGGFQMFDATAASKMRVSRTLMTKIQQGLDDGQFHLVYQPQVDCRAGRVVGLEGLIRWNHPVLGERMPAEFLPLVDQDDAIVRLGEWVLREALQQIGRWDRAGLQLPVTVNLAARHFRHAHFGERLADLLAPFDARHVQRLGLEIPEAAALEDLTTVARHVALCRNLGLRVGLDEFGAGFTALTQLSRIPAHGVKIEQGFVRDMLADAGQRALVRGVIGMARAFALDVVGVGAEGPEHVATLLALGCDVVQGYHLARPMAADQVPDWLPRFAPDPTWGSAVVTH